MWAENLMLLVINLPLVGLWVSMLKIPYRLLFPAIVLVAGNPENAQGSTGGVSPPAHAQSYASKFGCA